MSKAIFVIGIGFILIGVAAFLRDCESAFQGGACGSTTVASALESTDLYYYQSNGSRALNDVMFLPFSYTAFALGAVALIGGGLGALRAI
jgi:hypothetical protein